MTVKVLFRVASIVLFTLLSCSKSEKEPVAVEVVSYPVAQGNVDEASGMADSRANQGYLWIHQDSDTPSDLALLSHTGEFLKKIFIKNVWNRDWEDMAIAKGPDPSKNYIYISDMGDNYYRWSSYFIYRFPEPLQSADTVFNFEKIEFKYPDGYHDAEAFIVDPFNNDIYVITKRDDPSRVYLLKYPYSLNSVNTVSYLFNLPYSGVVGAALQPDNLGLAVKTYSDINHYPVSNGESMATVLKKNFTKLPYQGELQGEAFTFTNDGKGYFTLGERRVLDVTLNYYRK
ncbi:MAG TPA: hypothetical protein VFX73_10865 [Chitinophagaceae bacterium]|nr:hypothetical protein [Chitinophagaceae bacterium]